MPTRADEVVKLLLSRKIRPAVQEGGLRAVNVQVAARRAMVRSSRFGLTRQSRQTLHHIFVINFFQCLEAIHDELCQRHRAT